MPSEFMQHPAYVLPDHPSAVPLGHKHNLNISGGQLHSKLCIDIAQVLSTTDLASVRSL